MYQNVRDAFYDFNAPIEGVVSWMYLDIKGFVTVGVGNLLPDDTAAAALPFIHGSDPSNIATDDEKRQGWQTIHARQDLAAKGYLACKDVTDLRLPDAATRALVDSKLLSNEQFLKQTFPDFDSWPADAQLGLLSMAWAMGPGFPSKYPSFTAACKNQDFLAASAQCGINEVGNPGVHPRNVADQTLFTNAARVLKLGAGFGFTAEKLYYPTVILDQVDISDGGGSDSN